MDRDPRPRRARGFSLIELLVVLAILGTLTLVAARSMGSLEDRARFDRTQNVLAEIERGILGSAGGDATLDGGFLGDVGRLPMPPAQTGSPPFLELLQRPPSIAASHVAVDAVDPEVKLAAGWRGPYARLEPGAATLFDGYGSAVAIDQSQDGSSWRILSLGSNGATIRPMQSDGDDLAVVLRDPAQSIDLVSATLAGSVEVESPPPAGTWAVKVYAYSPNPNNGELVAAAEDADANDLAYAFSQAAALTAGPRALRAYLYSIPLPGGVTDPRTVAIRKSAVVRLALRHGAQNVPTITIPLP